MSANRVDVRFVEAGLIAVIGELDYDIHKSLECDEGTGENTYPDWVDVFVEAYERAANA